MQIAYYSDQSMRYARATSYTGAAKKKRTKNEKNTQMRIYTHVYVSTVTVYPYAYIHMYSQKCNKFYIYVKLVYNCHDMSIKGQKKINVNKSGWICIYLGYIYLFIRSERFALCRLQKYIHRALIGRDWFVKALYALTKNFKKVIFFPSLYK